MRGGKANGGGIAGWEKIGFMDTNSIFWQTKLEKGEFSNVQATLD